MGVSSYAVGTTALSRPPVRESAVANSVTSAPAATRLSVSSDTTRSQGP